MPDVATMHSLVLARLRTLSTVTVYDGLVPEHPPAESQTGRVFPYVVLWPDAGYRPVESRVLEAGPSSDVTWRARVTIASGSPGWTLQATGLVRARLEGIDLGPWTAPLEEEVADRVDVLEDRDVAPPRFYVPLSFITTTG